MVGVMKDITYHKLLEMSLRKLGDNLNQAQRVSGIGSWRYDIDTDEFFGSEEMYRIFNININEHLNDFENTLKLVHSEDQEKLREAIKWSLKGKNIEFEFRIPQPNGSNKYVLGKGESIFNEKGYVVVIHGTFQDITEKKLLEMKLEKSYRLLRQTEALGKTGSWETDLLNNTNLWSEETYKILGITPDEFGNKHDEFLKFVHPDDIKIIDFYTKNPVKDPFDMEFRIVRPNGIIRDVSQRVEFRFDTDDKPVYIYGTIQDITEKKGLQKEIEHRKNELDRLQKRFQILVEKSKDVFEIIEPNGTITYISEACENVIGCKADERLGKNIFDFYTKENQDKLIQLIEDVTQNPEKTVEDNVIIKTSFGSNINLEVHMQNFLSEPIINGIVILFRDITNRIKMEEKINYIHNHDEITGLPNRSHFKKYLADLCEKKSKDHSKFAIMMLELGRLNNIVYNLGYETRNILLIEVIKRLRKYIDNKIYISRYSDNNFAVIIEEYKSYGEYEKIAENLLNLFSTSFIVDKYQLDISVNIGICIYPDEAKDVDSIKKHAFAALHRSIKDGKNCCKFYSSDFDIQNFKELMIRNELHKAICNNQLKVFYQPMVELKTNEVIAAEALVRWEHPDWGIIPPNEFISIAEETGYITKIGDWMLEEVCKTYKRWITEGRLPIKISINFSSVQFFENNCRWFTGLDRGI